MDAQQNSLYIPMGLKAESEIFAGFGKAELFKSVGVILAAAVPDIILFLIWRKVETAIIFILVAAAAAIGFFVKDNTGNSMSIQLGNMARFMRSQKKYRYIQLNEWERGDR